MAQRTRALKFAGTLAAVAAALSAASCRVPPSPPPTANGSTVPISYAVFSWKDEKNFKRISEFFTDEEFTGATCVVRTDPSVRDGLYFILGIECGEKIPAGSVAVLRYFRPDKLGEQKAEFSLPEFTGTPIGEIRLGLTGEAWPKSLRGERPTAWEISVRAPDGQLLVFRQSFLWKQPEKKSAAADSIPETPADADSAKN